MSESVAVHSPFDERFCPVCEYALSGLARHAPCPECGSDTGRWARAAAAMARAAVDSRTRLVLLSSPGIGIVVGSFAAMSRGYIASVVILASCVAGAGIFAVWRVGRAPGAELMLGRILILGTLLGVCYFFMLILAAVLAVVPLALISKLVGSPSGPPQWVVFVSLAMGVVLAFAVLGTVAAILKRFARHARRR